MTLLGKSKPVQELISLIGKVSPTKTNILIIGESGTGKELVARMIHDTGILKGKPFIPINCGAIPESLIESELFGHRKGSFTGAINEKTGLFEVANGGSIFLDEVGELPLSMQVKILRAIQERAFRRVGGVDDIRIDVRIIAATNRDLEAAIAQGTFREDLYYRLNVIQIKTPPLRTRKDDIPLLAEHFLDRFNQRFGKKIQSFTPDALAALSAHSWPGNVRELENVIERAITLENGKKITINALPQAVLTLVKKNASSKDGILIPSPDFKKGDIKLDEILGRIEETFIRAALAHGSGTKKKTAQLLGITFRSLRYRMKKLGMEGMEGGEK